MQLELSDQEIEFYSRQLLVSGWGLKQQLALKNSIVVLSYENDLLALYLAGAGVGEIISVSYTHLTLPTIYSV